MSINERCNDIRLVLFDVDGVLTNGDIYIDGSGECFKQFNVKDGVSVALLKIHGVKTGVISGKHSDALITRCQQLNFDVVVTGCHNKIAALSDIAKEQGVLNNQIAFVGDDVIDLTVLASCGLSCAPADAHELVKNKVEFITSAIGGGGVAREVAEHILCNRGMSLEEVYQPLMDQWNSIKVVQ